ncbi:MAG: hypothetical protein H0T57_11590 [Rubrobacter sp.]|nr:hypothetical protein [Rubrobacter sp.]
MIKPGVYEDYLKRDTLKACAALWRRCIGPRDRDTLRMAMSRQWQQMLEREGFGRYDDDYVREALESLAGKLGLATYCEMCGDEIENVFCERYDCPSVYGEWRERS